MTKKPSTPADLEAPPPIGHNAPPPELSPGEKALAAQAELLARVEPIAERANKLPKAINSEEDLETITPVVVDAKSLSSDIEKARKAEKEPYLEGGRAVDGAFNPIKERVDRIVKVFEGLASDFQRRKIEAQRIADAEEARKAEARAAKLREEADAAKRPETAQRRHDLADAAEADAERAAGLAARGNAEIAKVKTTGGTASARGVWTFAIEDFDKVDLNAIRPFIPREAIEQGLRAYVKIQKGAAKLEGVRFFEDVKASFRR